MGRRRTGDIAGLPDRGPDALTRDERAVYALIRQLGVPDSDPGPAMVTRTDILRRSGLAEDEVSRLLARLVERGSIRAARTEVGELAFAVAE